MRLPGVLSAVLVLGIGPVPAFADDPGTAANSVVVWDLYAQNAIWDVAQQAPQSATHKKLLRTTARQ